MKKIVIILSCILVTLILLFVILSLRSGHNPATIFTKQKNTPSPNESGAPENGSKKGVPIGTSAIHQVVVIAKNWDFIPSVITVQQGDKLYINLRSVDVEHSFEISEFKIKQKASRGKPAKFEFTADKKGTFTYISSINSGPKGHQMIGYLVVE